MNKAIDIQLHLKDLPQINKNGWKNASKDDVEYYINPENLKNDKIQIFQFCNCNYYFEVDESEMQKYLDGKGFLDGQEKTFINAAKKYNLNPIYLAAHACTETGGQSELFPAQFNGETIYNAYGICAFDEELDDSIPFISAKELAYQNQWFTPEAAIDGGAKWISENYSEQVTLYEKRWNPNNPGQHQYATAVNWAETQAIIMEKLYRECFPSSTPVFSIPKYEGE